MYGTLLGNSLDTLPFAVPLAMVDLWKARSPQILCCVGIPNQRMHLWIVEVFL